jgi:Ca2+-binding RTX toxin-like protein
MGDDQLYGGFGDDVLEGSNGDDLLSGVDDKAPSGAGEIDQLSGGGGKDLFLLGDATTAFYLHAASIDPNAGGLD